MKILVCYKIVPEDQDITVNRTDKTLVLDKAALKISPYDLNSIEAGVSLLHALADSNLVAMSVGPPAHLENSKLRKDVLSRGPNSLSLVIGEAYAHLSPQGTAHLLAEAARAEGFDLILCGEGSGDLYSQQVGTLLGEYLGVPNINAVSRIIPGDGSVTVERTLENEVETLDLALPAVLSVTTDICAPKVPTMKNILEAGKKPVQILKVAADIHEGSQAVSVLAPDQTDRLKIIIEGDSDEALDIFIENIRKILVQA